MNEMNATTEKQPQVVEWSQRLEKSITETADRLDELSCRLHPVMRESQRTQGEGEDQPQLVPFASELRNRSQEVAGLLSRIEDILERLEI